MPVLSPEPPVKTRKEPAPPPPPPVDRNGRGGGDDRPRPNPRFPVSKARLAIWLALASITMMFAGLSSAYLVMRGSPAWQSIVLPSMLWVNTLALVASSATLEVTRRHLKDGRPGDARRWMTLTALLGLGFLAGQLLAWRQLNAAGVFLASTLQSSFLHIFTAMHGIHLLGGVVALLVLWRRTLGLRAAPARLEAVDVFATYWHFMDGLWLYLLLLFLLT